MESILLSLPPKSYLNLKAITPIAQASGECVVQGRVSHLSLKGKYLCATVADKTGSLDAVFFSHNNFHRFYFKAGSFVTLRGRLKDGEMIHPKIVAPDAIGTIKPVYKKGVTARKILKAIEDISPEDDPVPAGIRDKRGLPDMKETLRMLHFPDSMDDVEFARWRLAYTEIYAELSSINGRPDEGIVISTPQDKLMEFIKNFPFKLTGSQMEAISDILRDLGSGKAMRRMLIGDVGTGKTEVAIAAIYAAVSSGFRTLYLCPTEVLAIQTYHRMARALAGSAYVALYTASEKVKKATPDVLVGTHALLYNGWQHHKIGLVIIDEQHKFGVKQRERLIVFPECNFLELTATPIPRSYAMLMQSIMDMSILSDMPFKRNVRTELVVDKKDYNRIIGLVREEVGKGNQALIIYPSVESEKSNLRAARKAYEDWQKIFHERSDIDLLYGSIPDKESILKRFADGRSSVLISTSASEVGIDIPKLTVCVVVNAERFGLSQLHQMRGRVGRRGNHGYCCMICKNEKSQGRLKVLETTDDSFRIAEMDMNQRGFGLLSGDAQAGEFFRYFTLKDYEILGIAKEDVEEVQKKQQAFGLRISSPKAC